MSNSNAIQYVDEYLYVWKVPTPVQNVYAYIIGMEKTPGQADGRYLNKSNITLTPENKIFKGHQLTTQYPNDHAVHKYLKNFCNDWCTWDGETQEGLMKNTREAFLINKGYSEKDLLEALSMLLTQHPDSYKRRKVFILRDYQKNLLDQCKNKFLISKKECALQLSTRGGKSFLTLEIARQMGAKNILILTPMPMAKASFVEVAEESKNFTGWTYTDNVDIKKDKVYKTKTQNICLISFHKFEDTKESVNNMLKEINFDFIIVDEAHIMSDTPRSKEILKKFSDAKILYTSGTFFNDIFSKRFGNNLVNYDFIDLLEHDKKTHTVNFPTPIINNVCNMTDIRSELKRKAIQENWHENILSEIENRDIFDFKHIFSNVDMLDTFFNWAFRRCSYADGFKQYSWFKDHIYDEERHILMFVPSLNATETLKKVIKRYTEDDNTSILYGYQVYYVSERTKSGNDHQERGKSPEKSLNNFMNKNKKTIIVSVGRLTTGVTLHKLDTVFLMQNVTSAEKFVQILFRPMTPITKNGKIIKERAELYNFNSDTTLKVINEYKNVRTATGKQNSDKAAIEEFINYIQVNDCFSENESDNENKVIAIDALTSQYKFKKVLAEDFLVKTKDISLDYDYNDIYDENITSNIIYNYKDVLQTINLTYNKKSNAFNITDGNNNINTPKNNLQNQSNKNALKKDANKKDDEQLPYEKVMQMLNLLPYEIIINNIKELNDFERIKFSDENGIEFDNEVQKMIKEILKANEVNINNLINCINYNIEHRKYFSIINHTLSPFTRDDVSTPEVVRKQLFEKISDEKIQLLKNGKGKIFIPCCGKGSLLLHARDIIGIPPENIYAVDLFQKNVNLLHRIGFPNVIQGDIEPPKVNPKSPKRKYGIRLKELLMEKNMNFDFDAIIMNPPYDDNLHLHILNEIIETFPKAEISSVEPIGWLQDILAENKQGSDFKNFKNIRNHIKHIEVIKNDKANSYFNIAISSDLGIYTIDSNGGFDVYSLRDASTIEQKIINVIVKEAENNNFKKNSTGEGSKVDYKGIFGVINSHLGGKGSEFISNNYNLFCKPRETYTNKVIFFKTEEERKNCFQFLTSRLMRWFAFKVKTNQRNPWQFVPFLDWTRSYTDADIYKYFNFTSEEIEEIENKLQKIEKK